MSIDPIRALDETLASVSSKLDISLLSPNDTCEIERKLRNSQSEIMRLFHNGNHHRAKYEITRLMMFGKHLTKVESADPEFFELKKSELTSEKGGDYYGVRFEVDVAASLLEKGYTIANIDPPDFRISYEGEEIDIEATSAHFGGGDRTIEEKVKGKIRSKTRDEYSHGQGALFVDLTNIQFTALMRDEFVDGEILKEWTQETFDNFPSVTVGAVVYFIYLIERGESGQKSALHHTRTRSLNSNISEVLLDFLDRYYPVEEGFGIVDPYGLEEP